MIRLLTALVVVCAMLLLTGCKSPESRVDRFVETAVMLLKDGETARAVLELRNALQLDPNHEQARQILAETRRSDGEIALAARDYLALVGAHPKNSAGNLALAEIALEQGDWASAQKYAGRAAVFRDTGDRTQAVQLALAYREALQTQDIENRTAIAAEADALLKQLPQQIALHRLTIDSTVRQQAWQEALDRLDVALEQFPDSLEFRQVRLLVLQRLGRNQAIARQLEELVARFPQQDMLPDLLVGWHLHQGEPDAAEAFLRSEVVAAPDDRSSQLRLVAFLKARMGVAAALNELDALVMKGGPHDATYRVMRANLLFRSGGQSPAIVELEDLLQRRTDSRAGEAPTGALRIDLARMKHRTGDRNGAMSLVDSVLSEDPGHVTALKMRGALQIDANQLDEAVATLRRALQEAPRDPQLLTLMAAAHDRADKPDLRRQMLAAAVDTSGAGPAESLRLARLLNSEKRFRLAEETLTTSLDSFPEDISLLLELGMTYVALSDLPRAIQVGETLVRLSSKEQDTAIITADVTVKTRSPEKLRRAEAEELDATGDFNGALALYEALYNRFPSNEVVANNLAALLSTHRTDPASLERAFRIAHGLQNSKRPEIRDTYGWIVARLERFKEAERHLATAATELPENPTILYHYGVTLAQLGQSKDALEYLRRAEQRANTTLAEGDLSDLRARIAQLDAGEPH